MKWKIGLGVVVVLLILAQILFGGKKSQPGAEPTAPRPEQTEQAKTSGGTGDAVAAPGEKTIAPESIESIVIGLAGQNPAVRLEKEDGAWRIASLAGAPADADKVRLLLDSLLLAERPPISPPTDSEGDDVVGLGQGGLRVRLTSKDGEVHETGIGLRPVGRYDQAYALTSKNELVLIQADLRGIVGLWKNQPGLVPTGDVWLDRHILRFNPEEVVRLEASYPDHQIVFEKSAEGVWDALSYVPGGVWSRGALDAWLADLANFEVGGLAGAGEHFDAGQSQAHPLSIDVVLASGERKSVQVVNSHGDQGMLVLSLDMPGQIYRLPEWRFERYFLRMRSLFPQAAPVFAPTDIRFIDIRRGGENVKIAHRNGVWRTTPSTMPLRLEQVERLARLISQLRPEDYAAPGFKNIRLTYGSPMIEVTLDKYDSDVLQFRLAGRHPVFPWRYVLLTTPSASITFSVTDAEAGVLFPDFVDVLDLGPVFNGLDWDNLAAVELRDADGKRIATMRSLSDGVWLFENDSKTRELSRQEAASLIGEIAKWEVAGFYVAKPHEQPAKYRLEITTGDGMKKSVALLEPQERNVPYIAAGDMGFLLDRARFLDWLGGVMDISNSLDADAAREAAEKEAAEKEAARLAAEREEAEKEAARLAVEREEAEKEAARLAAEREEAEKEAARLVAEREEAEKEAARLVAEREEAEKEAARLAAEREEAEREAARVEAEKEAARATEDASQSETPTTDHVDADAAQAADMIPPERPATDDETENLKILAPEDDATSDPAKPVMDESRADDPKPADTEDGTAATSFENAAASPEEVSPAGERDEGKSEGESTESGNEAPMTDADLAPDDGTFAR